MVVKKLQGMSAYGEKWTKIVRKKIIVTKWKFYFSPPHHKNFYGLRKFAFF